MRMIHLNLSLCICLMTLCRYVAAQEAITAPVQKIDPSATVIYCVGLMEIRPQETKNKNSISATTEKYTARLVLEIDKQTLYVHHREDYDNGSLYWGHMLPHDMSAILLDRTSGDGLWILTMDRLWAKEAPRAKDYPDATGMHLSCSYGFKKSS